MDSHSLDMMVKEKEMSTAITWKANECQKPSPMESVCHFDPSETLEGLEKKRGLHWTWSYEFCLLLILWDSLTRGTPQLHPATDTLPAFYRTYREL